MTNIQNITLDLTNPHISPPPVVYAKQGDSGSRKVTAKIIDNGNDVTTSAPCRVYFSGVGGGSPCYITGTLTSGAVTFIIPQTATRKSGTVKAEVQILNSNNAEEVIATMSFDLVVKQTAYNVGAIVGTNGENLADQYVDEVMSAHNISKSSHADIRKKIADDISAHNTSADAHENRFSIIQSQLDQKVPTAYVTGAIADHNTSANAHEVLFGTLNTRVDGLDGGLIYANAKLNTNTNAIVEALKLTGTYIVGIGQTEIANDAYQNNSNIKVVSIADSVTTIGNYAFSSDTSLTNIAIPESVTSIGNYTFAWCSSLKGITIPNSVTSIGTGICRACTSLKNATIGNGVSSIGEGIFYGCTALTSVTLGSGFNVSLDISSGSYTADVMVAMFNNLKDLTGQTAKTLTLGSANLAKLTAEQKAIATNKNWNLA